MKTISALLMGILFAAVLGGTVRLLCPEGKSNRMMSLLVGLYVLVSVLVPLQSLKKGDFTFPTVNSRQGNMEQAVLASAQQAIQEITEEVLHEHGVQGRVEISMTVQNGEAHTKSFVLYGVPKEQEQEIRDEIIRLTGETPRFQGNS